LRHDSTRAVSSHHVLLFPLKPKKALCTIYYYSLIFPYESEYVKWGEHLRHTSYDVKKLDFVSDTLPEPRGYKGAHKFGYKDCNDCKLEFRYTRYNRGGDDYDGYKG